MVISRDSGLKFVIFKIGNQVMYKIFLISKLSNVSSYFINFENKNQCFDICNDHILGKNKQLLYNLRRNCWEIFVCIFQSLD